MKNQRVYAPWTSYNRAKRLEYPIEAMVIAKAAYLDRFADIQLHEWILEFYQPECLRGQRSDSEGTSVCTVAGLVG